ncbi:hypothetical protein P154DRAFT_518926 [Amniculicola lignicola CBS 123094]|uniref:DUF7918 domain-containing protein n=1 Tax=Amniculicola lignicola CBS 123094 TaxID=1392246 RepID=A0A6A5WUT2_9PLEO|nr:hypothetical protein P154DRAFT_518926 [Amniculicola lignicola CBS 123094]
MAIIPDQPSLQVEVLVNGTPLQEYDDDEVEASPTSVTKYIEAKSGAEFAIRWTFTPPFPKNTVMLDIFLDGKWMRGVFANQKNFHGIAPYSYMITGAVHEVGKGWFERKFCFSKLTVTDADARSTDEKVNLVLKEMGNITVKAHNVKNLTTSASQTLSKATKDRVGPVPEKSLKGSALSHQATLGKAQASRKQDVLTCDYIDPNKRPFATFNMKYRSRDALQSLLVIPRPAAPLPLEERNVDDLTPEEMRELLRRQRAS